MAFPFEALNSACVLAFGETISYTHAGTLVTENVSAIRSSTEVEQNETPGEYIALFVDVATVAPAKGDTITIGEDVWTAFKVIPDAAGGARVLFARTASSA